MNALIQAVNDNDIKTVKKLIKSGFDLNLRDEYDRTALMYACILEMFDIVKLLIKHKADLDLLDIEGYPALMLTRDKKIRIYLIKKGAR